MGRRQPKAKRPSPNKTEGQLIACRRNLRPQPVWTHVEAVRPSGRSVLQIRASEIFGITQRLSHRASLRHEAREVALTYCSVAERCMQAMAAEPFDVGHVVHRFEH